MKLYIATTSLNFDTIMSTESISPARFYPLRRFGIPYMYDKVSLCLPNSILLLDNIPYYNINRDEYDHRPLIIEIDTAFYPDGYFKEIKKGIYQTSKTIYLSPQSSSILFLSYEDYTVTLNKSANIVETKYILYKKSNRISVASPQQCVKIGPDTFKGIEDIEKMDEEALRRDILINKAKGFITGYLIGRGKSLTAESARLLNLTRQIKDKIYALVTVNSSEKSRMYQELRVLINEANQISWKLDDNKIRISSAINEDLCANEFNEEEVKKFRKYLSKRGLYTALISQLCPGAKLFSVEQAVLSAANAPDDQELDSRLKVLTEYTNSILKYTSDKQDLNSLIKYHSDLKVIECYDGSLDDDSKKIVPIIYNLFSDQYIRSEEFKSKRIDYIVDIAKILQSKSEINFQLIRDYINGLLDNLEEAKPFNINSSELAAINSFGAFIKAPDSDIEKLLSILLSNEISDHRIALALWGIIYGYSNIPNYCFKQWVSHCDSTEIEHYLSLVNTQIYGNIDFKCEAFSSRISSPIEDKASEIEASPKSSLFPNKEVNVEKDSELKKSEGKAHTNNGVQSRAAIDEYKDKISETSEDILEENKPKRKQAAFLSYYKDQIEIILSTSTTFGVILQRIDGISPEEGKSNWKTAKSKIKAAIKEIEKEYSRKHESVFNNYYDGVSNSSKSFLTDTMTWEKIASHVANNPALSKQLKKDFDWFRSNYFVGNYETNPKDNRSVLDHFYRFLMKKVNEARSYNSFSKEYTSLTYDTVDRIMSTLKALYL